MIGDLDTFLRKRSVESVKRRIKSDPYLVDAACIFWDGSAYNFRRLTGFVVPWWMSDQELELILKEVKEERDSEVKEYKEKKKVRRKK